MAGLDRKVLNSRRITKQVAPSNPVFSRSFITSFGVAFHNRCVMLQQQHCAPSFICIAKKTGGSWSVDGNGVYLHRKTN